MSDNIFRLGDYGTISITLIVVDRTTNDPIDISTSTDRVFVFQPPRGLPLIEKTPVYVTDGTDGKLKYTVETGLFDKTNSNLAGKWKVQAVITFDTGEITTDPAEFEVMKVLG